MAERTPTNWPFAASLVIAGVTVVVFAIGLGGNRWDWPEWFVAALVTGGLVILALPVRHLLARLVDQEGRFGWIALGLSGILLVSTTWQATRTHEGGAVGPTLLKVALDVRNNTTLWNSEAWGLNGDLVEFRALVENVGENAIDDLEVGVSLPALLEPVVSSVRICEASTPECSEEDRDRRGGADLFSGALSLDATYQPNSEVEVTWLARIVFAEKQCGVVPLTAEARADGKRHQTPQALASAVINIDTGDACTPLADEEATSADQADLDCRNSDVPLIAGGSWGPERPTFTMQHPATYPTLNSISDNPSYGDERTFFDVKDARITSRGGFCTRMAVVDGQELLLRFYVENSAADNLAGESLQGPGVARDVTARVVLPDERAASIQSISGEIESSNTDPSVIYAGVVLEGTQPFRIDYLLGSATLYSNARPTGVPLPDSIWTGDGAILGVDSLNGVLPPGYEYSLIVTLRVRISHIAQ